MQLIHPRAADDVDVDALYAADARIAAADDRPWLLVNMVASADGATTVAGRSAPLGGEADRAVFGAIRAVADVVLVGAETVRAERYGPPRPSAAAREARLSRGQAPAPRLAVVTTSLELDPGSRLFAEADPANRPLVLTAQGGSPEQLATLAAVAEEVIVVGDGRVDVAAAVAALGHRGAGIVLAEGGPNLNGQIIAAGLLDELCLTLSPLLVGGDSARLAHGAGPELPLALRLDRVLEADGALFLRYLRA